jgi:hypothetical protein
LQYRFLARDLIKGRSSDRDKVLALFAWTREHIRPTPPGFPVVDDHILHIIIRGYGQDDQMADVFTTLTVYAGIPSFWRVVKVTDGDVRGRVILSFARVGGRWAVFDVARGFVMADASGRLLDVGELTTHPALVQTMVGVEAPAGIPYRRYVERLQAFQVPAVLRTQKQMPLPRLAFETRRFFHLTGAVEAVLESEDETGDEDRP